MPSSRSTLEGRLSVAGDRAGFVIVNPLGISCLGCGFYNMSQVTLASGNLAYDKDNAAIHFSNPSNSIVFDKSIYVEDDLESFRLLSGSVKVGSTDTSKHKCKLQECKFRDICR